MRHALLGFVVATMATLAAFAEDAPTPAPPGASGLDGTRIEALTGAKGKLDAAEGVFKVSVPRTDLAVKVAGAHVTPPMGLTSWAAFTAAGDHTMVMGDMVMTEDQVNPVMDVAFANGLEVTALHNHFFWDWPRVVFMHIGGSGSAEALAAAVGKVFARIRETAEEPASVPRSDVRPGRHDLDGGALEKILGTRGKLDAGVYKVVIGRTIQMGGHVMGAAMGVNTWAAFAGSDVNAVVDGDFAVLESELQGVLRTLRANGVSVVAIHNHMAGEEPRMLFVHYWGVGSPADLARGLRAALDQTGSAKP
jgi:hypothetical protein